MNPLPYELCRELKDAGFVQTGRGHYEYGERFESEEVYVPQIEELIDACGEDFFSLAQIQKGEWQVTGPWNKEGEYRNIINFNKTPAEAVARLWLALNLKK